MSSADDLPAEPATAADRPAGSPATDRAEKALARLTAAMGGAGEERPGQHEMCRAVAEAVTSDRHLVVQAGTGTGKSLAYLAGTVGLGKRTVIATATKALQDQLATKELPFIAEHLGRKVSWAILKGRSNYLCLQRLDEVGDPNQRTLEGLETLPDRELLTIRKWAAETESGDRAEMPIEPSTAVWSAVSVGPRECPGASRCPRGDDCFAEHARRRAGAADVVVVNTHLYGLHLSSGRMVLPDHDVLVVDEAHELADIVSATSTIELGAGRFANVARVSGGLIADDTLVEGIETIGVRIEGALSPLVGERIRDGVPEQVGTLLGIARQRLNDVMDAARKIDSGASGDVATRVARVQTACGALVGDVDRFLAPPPDAVVWVESDRDHARICMAPLDVGRTLDELLWDPDTSGLDVEDDPDTDPLAGLPDSVVLTSATIPGTITEQLHLPADATTVLDVGTPFDFKHQALLYCATSLPDPRKDEYAPAMIAELEQLIRAARGRTLALFTSYRMMQRAADELAGVLPYEVLVQGQKPKNVLVAEFAEDESSCLFATMGYWQGIDVPGPALSLVTIDKIPFPRPDEPLWQARREAAGPRAFQAIDVPRAATLLAQGVGRLIRSTTDRGVVAVLDPRLATSKSYRWQLISALPPMPRTRDLADVEAFFAAE